jgi:cell division protein FtsI/penicillin-binding protein 2
MNEWLRLNEHIWLFWLIAGEALIGLATLTILVIEYIYDKQWNETKNKKKRTVRNRVKVIIDPEGNARIAEAPKDLDVSIEHEGETK